MRRATVVQGAMTIAAIALVLWGAWGCSKDLVKVAVPNQRPEVQLTSAPIDTSGRYFYSITLNWKGYDADGRVDHYLYAIDPPTSTDSDTAWIRITDNEKRLTFSASQPDPVRLYERAIDPHTFVIKAVDNVGESGPPVGRSFFSFTVAPTVRIESPAPNFLLTPVLTPTVRFIWSGTDADGVFNIKPVRYKYKLFSSSDPFPIALAASQPDSLRRYYAPAFAESLGWKATSAETTQVQFTSLTPGQTYLFVVVAFDEAGAYSPSFSLSTNMLRFKVGFAGTLGPVICFFNEFFNYCYVTGGYRNVPSAEVEVEIPEGVAVTVNWGAEPPPGSNMRFYRWAVDIEDLDDPTTRSDELTDTSHWSTSSLLTTSATVGPFFVGAGEAATEYRLYLEAEDSNKLRSLGIIRFRVVAATFDKELLIVDDTRMPPSSRSFATACGVQLPLGTWPNAAELDTFLYARGGVPWKCYEPATSSPGLFAGYPFDTIGTRTGKSILTVPLGALVTYKRIVWIVDGFSATFGGSGTDIREPMTALRYMTDANRVNTLSTYLAQGGLLWLVGGGVAFASQEEWNETGNDESAHVFSSITSNRELGPGRFMYDVAKWTSEIRATSVPSPRIIRYTGRFQDSLSRVGASSPYAQIPPQIELKSRSDADDLPPPGRDPFDFYSTGRFVEVLQKPNDVAETVAPPTGVTSVVVSQVFAGGGETGAAYNRDFVELRNRGSATVNLNGWTLQYSTGGTAWQSVPLSGSVLAGRHYLVALASGATGAALPTPDASGTINLATSGGKIAVVKTTATLSDSCAPILNLQDLFGYGDGDCSEVRPFVRLDASNAAFRRSRGCEDTNVSGSDFYCAAPLPLNSGETSRTCFEVPVLDTLYRITSETLPPPVVSPHLIGMTYYHGPDHNPVMFTGFDIWGYRRRQTLQLVDFVLGRLWGLQRAPAATAALAPRSASPEANRGSVVTAATPASRRASPKPGIAPSVPQKPTRSNPRWPWSR